MFIIFFFIYMNKTFTISSGNAAGLKVKYSGLGADATVFYGQSLIEKLTSSIAFFLLEPSPKYFEILFTSSFI